MPTRESCFAKKGNLKNEIARFCTRSPRNPAISNPPVSQKLTHAQWLRNCSRTTNVRDVKKRETRNEQMFSGVGGKSPLSQRVAHTAVCQLFKYHVRYD